VNGCRSVIVGVGNPIRSDDAVGIAVARLVHERLAAYRNTDRGQVDLIETAVGGFDLIEQLAGYDKAVVIDAIQTEGGRAGDCYVVDLEGPLPGGCPSMTHHVGLMEGLALARVLAMDVPEYLRVYAVEAADVRTFGTGMTDRVKAAVPQIAEEILANEFGASPRLDKRSSEGGIPI